MIDLPDPLTTAADDVRDMDGFLLNVERLTASELVVLASGDEFKAAVMLWCRAWKQVPAGSLPDDDRILAAFSGAGRKWGKVKLIALKGFVKCSDGRLYHRVLCEDVKRAALKKQERIERTKAATEAKKKKEEAKKNNEAAQRDDSRNGDRNDQRNDDRNEVAKDQRDVAENDNVTTSQLSKGKVSKVTNKNLSLHEFEIFWKEYPLKVDRGAAEKAYAKARKIVEAETLLEAVKRFAKQIDRNDMTYVKRGASWLNGKCWLDEPIAKPAAQAQAAMFADLEPDDRKWMSRLADFDRDAFWLDGQWGPPPSDPRCQIPAYLRDRYQAEKNKTAA